MKHYDVVIAGAGPAGLSLARELSSSNLKVFVFDPKSRADELNYYTCGSFINPKEYGLPDNATNSIKRLYFCSAGRQAVKKSKGCVVNKKILLEFLQRQSLRNPNCVIQYDRRLTSVKVSKEGIDYIVLDSGEKIKGIVYADCTGLSRAICSKVGIKPNIQRTALGIEYLVNLRGDSHAIDLFVGSRLKGGYGWIFPLNSRKAIIGYGTFDKKRFGNIEKYLKEMWAIERVKERCLPKPLETHKGVSVTGIQRRIAAKNVVCIGDSALQATPVVGEGIRAIMEASGIAAKSIIKAVRNQDLSLLREYEKTWNAKHQSKYLCSLMMQILIRRKSSYDRLMDAGARRLEKMPDEEAVKLIKGDITFKTVFNSVARTFFRFSG
jgi:digeranylgeranylglycerophospholipid reductase